MTPGTSRMAAHVVAACAMLALACARHGATYSGAGEVLAVDQAGRSLTIRHGEIQGLMPAMTMEFPVRSPQLLAGVTAGEHVGFELARDGDHLTVTQVSRLAAADAPHPGVHDHTPQHGGVVAMAGMIHLEVVADPEGRVRVYVTDVWRRPIPLDGSTGAITLDLPDGPETFPAVVRDGALEATTPRLPGSSVRAHVRLTREGNDIEEHFLLPLGAAAS